jgi:hypothetical protein
MKKRFSSEKYSSHAHLSDEKDHTDPSASPHLIHLPPPFAWALIDQNTRLGTWDALSRGFIEVLCDEFHQKCELVIGNDGKIIFTAESFFFLVSLLAGQSEKMQLGTRPRE